MSSPPSHHEASCLPILDEIPLATSDSIATQHDHRASCTPPPLLGDADARSIESLLGRLGTPARLEFGVLAAKSAYLGLVSATVFDPFSESGPLRTTMELRGRAVNNSASHCKFGNLDFHHWQPPPRG